QRDMLPLYGAADAENLISLLAKEAGVDAASVVGHDLFVYNRQSASVWGANGEFMSSPKLDDLQCAWSSLVGFLESDDSDSLPVHVVFDNEEVGSMTKQGAASTLLKDTLRRICECLGLGENSYLSKLPQSFMLSGDNAHAMHPNYADKCDPVNHPKMNGGVVLKYSGSQKYTTDGASAAILHVIAERAGVHIQDFTNHSDIPGGATLGNISAQQVAVKTADIGIAQLAMHSPYETCGSADTEQMVALVRKHFSSVLTETADGCYIIK
ncbi:MAG: M18 family aminopeptidase, partial [Oscillospiraceae bacterium]|nr:M18 family aminopeptidase [Oscillospiraceae bacterium]